MDSFNAITDQPAREAAFEPLLDQLAEIFDPDLAPWRARPDGREPNWYERCETKRLAIARAAAQKPDEVRAHAELVLRAIVHDTDRSGNRQLIQVALRALGTRAVLTTLIEYVEAGGKAQQYGAAMAMYWAHPAVAFDLRDTREHRAEIEAENNDLADLRSRARQASLLAFLAADDPAQRAELSLRFTLNPVDYPSTLTTHLAHALDIAIADGGHDKLLRTLPPEPDVGHK